MAFNIKKNKQKKEAKTLGKTIIINHNQQIKNVDNEKGSRSKKL